MSEQTVSGATLYVVATPIGNLEDISSRALHILSNVDFILCEDTRHSSILLDRYQIRKKLVSYFAHNEALRTDQFLPQLQAGQSAAVITDAGTPGISDPGSRIADACHEAGLRVCPVPGPSAVVTALSAAGFYKTPSFRFMTFFPRKQSERYEIFERQKTDPDVLVGYESPQRVTSLFEDAVAILGADWRVCLCRELTKKFEEITRATTGELLARLRNEPCRGELCILFEGGKPPEKTTDALGKDAERMIALLKTKGLSARDIRDVVAQYFNLKPKLVYRYLLEMMPEA